MRLGVFQFEDKKVHETPILIEKSWAWWHVPIIPEMAGSIK
jgi:hypothetical protein